MSYPIAPFVRPRQGFGLIELMISMAIASVMILGLMLMMGNMQSSYSTQTDLAGVSDKERFAGELFANNIQTAGYYTVPNPVTFVFPNPIVAALPAVTNGTGGAGGSSNYAAGQVVSGLSASGSVTSDQLNVRFESDAGDPVYNSTCQGGVHGTTAATTYTYESVFYVSNNNLYCNVYSNSTFAGVTTATTAGTPVILIDGVTKMQILYGVDVSGTSQTGSVTEYFTYSALPSLSRPAIRSVKVTLTFASTNNISTPPTYSQTYQVMYAVP